MNKKKLAQFFILLIIFLSMFATILVSRSLFLANNETYQPTTQQIKIKASQKTYSKLLSLNRIPSVRNDPTSTPLPEGNPLSPSPLISSSPTPVFSTESPTPTEIILAKAVSLNAGLNTTTKPTSELISNRKENQELPASGFYQNFQWLFIISALIILFSFGI